MEDLTKYIDHEGHAVIPNGITLIEREAFSGRKDLTSIVIPNGVKSIGPEAFSGCTNLASIIIPYGVEHICEEAFYDCESLTSIVLPNSVKEIIFRAFCGCTNLTSIVIPKSVEKILDYAFDDCPNLTIICPEGSCAEQYCKKNSLHFIYDYQYEAFHGFLPPGFKKLASPFLADEEKPFIFISYSHRDRDEVLPIIKTLYESGWKIWYDEGLTIGDSYDETLENHVRDCSTFLLFVTRNSLNSLYCKENEIPWAIRYGKPIIRCILDEGIDYPIREDAVAATVLPSETEAALEKIGSLNKGEKRIAKGISVVINPEDRNESDSEKKEDGFAYCLYATKNTAVIKSILLETKNSGCSLYDASGEGEDIEKLQSSACLIVFLDKAFLSDKHLTDILIKKYQAGKDIAVCMIENIEDTDLPQDLLGLHKMQWLNYAHGISGDMNTKLFRHLQKRGCRNTAILPGFEYEKTEQGIIINQYTGLNPNLRIESEYGGIPVIAISEEAFKNNSHIETVIISEGITEIKARTFENCGGLTSVTIPNSVKTIGEEAFKNCTSLASIIIPDSVTEIGREAFENCESLNSVIISNNLTKIGWHAFRNCTGLTSVIIPNSLTHLGWGTFQNCASLASITIPDGVEHLGSDVFCGCTSLTSTTIPGSVKTTGSAFINCTGLTSIVIPDSVTEISDKAFRGCTHLTSIVIPDSVTKIGDYAFSECTSLTSIIIPKHVQKIGWEAFDGCTNLTSIIIPDSVTEIGTRAFSHCPNLTVTCPPGSEAWEYCDYRGISLSIPENMKKPGQASESGNKDTTIKPLPEVLEMTEENMELVSGLLYCSWANRKNLDDYKRLSDAKKSTWIDDAIRAFCVAEAAKAKICSLSYKDGTRLFTGQTSDIDWHIYKDTQSLYIQKMVEHEQRKGNHDYSAEKNGLKEYGGSLWADHLERITNNVILALEKAGYGYYVQGKNPIH